ncbi:Mu transposase C-terminal domain-containing protein [Flavobacterium psychrophilum]|uniref:Mu transposase C-terminal domain-containing protein n=1 Tax=Flavobacterium psychrophilum TaxID=96345 RepID=UPI001D078C26|nr:Mu transposase C-terminal domain-containing protein [Flavobacterium psychrophilum]MCB6062524.1 Mu transposase C-terminal domain-containing protein [Flavobacterium psychrophilum]MEB3378384.1 Mu transposase C-terminal domain-containing protein [Flavobacterium psychrophilum]
MNCYVTFEILVGFGLDANTIYSGCKRYRQGKTKSWQNKKDATDARKVLINIDTIPNATRLKHGIPTGKEYSEQRLQQYEAEQERQKIERHEAQEREKTILASNELQALRNAYYNEYIQYIPLYKEYYAGNKRIEHLSQLSAKEHAFFLEMIDVTGGIYRGDWGKAEQGFNHYRLLTKELIFMRSIHNIQNFRALLRDLRNCLSVGKSIVDVIGYGKAGKKPKKYKTNDFHIAMFMLYMSHPKKYSLRLIAEFINVHCSEENQEPISESWVKHFKYDNNELTTIAYSKRNGAKYANETIYPRGVRLSVPFPASLWMIDGTPIQFYCWNENRTKILRPCLFVILDAFSRKVVGFDFAPNEDKFMVINALKMAIKNEGHIAGEIISDNFTANKTEEIKLIKEEMVKFGTNWRLCGVGNPQDKAQVERFIGVFQSEECAKYDNYIGEGITSRRDNRPNAEFLAEKSKDILTYNQMKLRVANMVTKYNAREKRTRKSPNELYKMPKGNPKELDCFDTALLFWTRTSNTIRQGTVKITVNKVDHYFKIKDHDLCDKLLGKKVYVRYDVEDLSSVMIFDYPKENALAECKAIKGFNPIENGRTEAETKELFKQVADKKAHKANTERKFNDVMAKGLDAIGKEEIQRIHPLALDKNVGNDKESQDFLEMASLHLNIPKDTAEPPLKPEPFITKNGFKKNNATYEDGIVNKKKPLKASFKPVNAPPEN